MVPQPIGRRKTLLGVAGAAFGAVSLTGAASDSQAPQQQGAEASQPNKGPASGSRDRADRDDQDTIQAAVDAANEGDTVRIQPGTYSESVIVDTADIRLTSTDSREATIDATGSNTGVRIEADGVTLEGFEIVGDDETTSGVSIVTSAGATRDITIRDNWIHGMAKPGGGGVFSISSWGVLSWGDTPLQGVKVNRNTIEDIGGDEDELPAGIGIDLEEVEGGRRREGAIVWGNTVRNIADAEVSGVDVLGAEIDVLDPGIRLPGVGIAIQPLDGETSEADDAATDVHRNDIEETAVDVIMGDVGFSRVFNNNR